MKLYAFDNSDLMEVSKIYPQDNNLVIEGTIMGAMPIRAILKPAELRKAKLRVEVDSRNERMQGKIRDAQLKKVPYMLVVGDREAEAKAAAVRVRGGGDLGSTPVADIVARLREERDSKALDPGVFRLS